MAETLLRPVLGGLVILVALIGLIGSAIHDPKPHGIPVGLVGPAPAVQQLSTGFERAAPGAFDFTAYSSEDAARTALDARTVDGVLLIGGGGPRLIVAGAAGDGSVGIITGAFSNAFKAQGATLAVEMVHPFPAGDGHGLVLFFVVVALLVSSLVAAGLLGGTGGLALLARVGALVVFAVLAGAAGMGMASWIAGDYGAGTWPAAGLLALAALAVGTVVAGSARLIGTPGLGLAALVVVLLDLVSSGGPIGSRLLPDFYRWLAPGMPAGQLYSGLRGVLFFDNAGVGIPVGVLSAWLLGGLLLMVLAEVVARRREARLPPGPER